MDLEEHTLDKTGSTCEVCGAKLTEHELRAVLESGGPALCTSHAAELEPALETDEAEFIE
jgi:hypothetical protein